MARSLLAPTAFLTLLGLAPGCFRATATPVVAAISGATDEGVAKPESASTPELVAYATTRSGNARAPSYDDAMMEIKGPDNFVDLDGIGPQPGAPQAVVLALETTLQRPVAANP